MGGAGLVVFELPFMEFRSLGLCPGEVSRVLVAWFCLGRIFRVGECF